MFDISLSMKDMEKFALSAIELTWIDHHISAINDYKEFVGEGEIFCNAVLENGAAACEGTWKYMYPEISMPLAVKLFGEYDTWRNDDKTHWENEVMPFQYRMKAYCNSGTFNIQHFSFNTRCLAMIIDIALTFLILLC
jgi:oligoribonuclease NrnB/cAMP/cGMP phosphodiesterase (DHH superfamily)